MKSGETALVPISQPAAVPFIFHDIAVVRLDLAMVGFHLRPLQSS